MSACKKVLIVDDDPNIRALLENLLHINDFKTCSVNSAEQALSMLKIKPFDIIITDHNMSGMNGSYLSTLIKWDYPKIFIIGISDKDFSYNFLHAGADVFLSKPLNFNELLTIVKKEKSNYTE